MPRSAFLTFFFFNGYVQVVPGGQFLHVVKLVVLLDSISSFTVFD